MSSTRNRTCSCRKSRCSRGCSSRDQRGRELNKIGPDFEYSECSLLTSAVVVDGTLPDLYGSRHTLVQISAFSVRPLGHLFSRLVCDSRCVAKEVTRRPVSPLANIRLLIWRHVGMRLMSEACHSRNAKYYLCMLRCCTTPLPPKLDSHLLHSQPLEQLPFLSSWFHLRRLCCSLTTRTNLQLCSQLVENIVRADKIGMVARIKDYDDRKGCDDENGDQSESLSVHIFSFKSSTNLSLCIWQSDVPTWWMWSLKSFKYHFKLQLASNETTWMTKKLRIKR